MSQHLQGDSEPARTNTVEITMAVVHRHRVRTSLPQPLQCDSQPVTTIALQITMVVAHRTAGAPSGDHARRSPFCSLWTLRRTLRREPGPQRRPRAPQPLLQSLDTAERAGPPAATTRAAAPSAVSGHCRESRAPSGDHARRSPFFRREPE